MNVEERLKFYRVRSGMSQDQVAEEINVSRQTISKWENGKSSPDVDSIVRLADLYNISLDELLRSDKESETQETLEETKHDSSQLYIILAIVSIVAPLGFLLAIGLSISAKKKGLKESRKISKICYVSLFLNAFFLIVDLIVIFISLIV